ncbi:MAG TPA: hypothetical protein VGD49_07040 [Longimicrobiales bacterium]
MEHPWEYYYATFEKRAARVPNDAFGRSELLYEAAHDAYETTANALTGGGWDEEQALMITRIFGQVVKDWLARDGQNLNDLREELRRHYDNWTR